jgi:hypothetical protein
MNSETNTDSTSASAETDQSSSENFTFENVVLQAGLNKVKPNDMYCRSFHSWFAHKDLTWEQTLKEISYTLSTKEFFINVIEEGSQEYSVNN